jgi:hypothetical protein
MLVASVVSAMKREASRRAAPYSAGRARRTTVQRGIKADGMAHGSPRRPTCDPDSEAGSLITIYRGAPLRAARSEIWAVADSEADRSCQTEQKTALKTSMQLPLRSHRRLTVSSTFPRRSTSPLLSAFLHALPSTAPLPPSSSSASSTPFRVLTLPGHG